MIKKNVDVRKAAKDSGVFLWKIADKLGVSEPTVNRKHDVCAVCPKGGTDAANKGKQEVSSQGNVRQPKGEILFFD